MTWTHSPETAQYGEAWRLRESGEIVAQVVCHSARLYSACIFALGRPRKVGDVYASASGAKAACVRRLKKTGVLNGAHG